MREVINKGKLVNAAYIMTLICFITITLFCQIHSPGLIHSYESPDFYDCKV